MSKKKTRTNNKKSLLNELNKQWKKWKRSKTQEEKEINYKKIEQIKSKLKSYY